MNTPKKREKRNYFVAILARKNKKKTGRKKIKIKTFTPISLKKLFLNTSQNKEKRLVGSVLLA